MKSFRLFLLGAILGWLQGTLEMTWSFGGPAPDFFLLYLIWLGLTGRTAIGLLAGFVGGLLQDSVTGMDLMGIHSLGRLFVAYLPEWGRMVLVPDHRLAGVLMVVVGTLLQSMILLSIHQTLASGNLWNLNVLYSWFFSVILNTGAWLFLVFTLLPEKKSEYAV